MSNHIEKERMTDLLLGKVSLDEKLEMMSHIANCDECSLLLATLCENMEQLECPKGFKEEVVAKTQAQIIPKKQENFSVYVIKTMAAMCAALILLFSGVFTKIDTDSFDSVKEKSAAMTEKLNSTFNSFSDKMMYWED